MKTAQRILLLSLMAASAYAADFSGTWKLDAAKSDFGPIPPPESMTRVVSQTDSSLTFQTTQKNAQGEVVSKYTFLLDGTEATTKTSQGEVKGTATREGEAIRIKTKREAQGMEITFDELWTLSADGKTLNVANKVGTPQGDFDIKLVLAKQ